MLINVTDTAGSDDFNGFIDGNDSTSTHKDDYEYDNNGNMILDRNKGIEKITYNHLNLPVRISFDVGKSIQYTYNAAGQKVNKTIGNNGSYELIDYMDGFQYAGSVLQYFPTPEGYVNITPLITNSGTPLAYRFNYVYNYTDHLGNIRISYTKDPSNGKLKIIDENHYYPFGLKHERYLPLEKWRFIIDEQNQEKTRLKIAITDEYKYKYNGKEWQDELGLNMYAMDMRMYDPAIARWVVHDPIVHFNQSPYSSFDGNPVYWADPSGAATSIQEMWDATPEGGSTHWVNTGDGNFEEAEEEENDDIIIYGTDGNRIRIITAGEDVPFFIPFALGESNTWDLGLGNIDKSRFGVGYKIGGSLSISAIMGAKVGGGIVVVNFFNDDYGWYFYHYLEGDFEASGGLQGGGSANLDLNFFLIYNTSVTPDFNPLSFEGKSSSTGLSFNLKKVVGGGFSAYGFKSGNWNGFGIGVNVGGGGYFSANAFIGNSNSILLNNVKKTRDRTWGDKIENKVFGTAQAIFQHINK